MKSFVTLSLPGAAAGLILMSAMAFAQDEAGDPEQGMLTFNNYCRQCHVANEGDDRLGPNLYGLIGREAGSVEGFAYSPAFQRANFVWDEERLNNFIANTSSVVPGNRMQPFDGVPDATARADIVAFLASRGGDETQADNGEDGENGEPEEMEAEGAEGEEESAD